MVGKRGKGKFKGGKEGKKPAICRTFVYVKSHSEKLAEIITSLCIEGAMSLKKGMMGISFIFPSKDMLKSIVDAFEGGHEEVARDKIFSLILPDKFAVAEDFKKKPVGSKIGALYTVKDASGDKVSFTSPGGDWSIKHADDYRELEGNFANGKISIWQLVSGEPPMKTEEVYTIPYEPRKTGKLGGGPSEEEHAAEAKAMAEERNRVRVALDKLKIDIAGKSAHDASRILGKAFSRLFPLHGSQQYGDVEALIDADPVVNYVLFITMAGAFGPEALIPRANFGAIQGDGGDYSGLLSGAASKVEEFVQSSKSVSYQELRKNFDAKVNYQQFQDNQPTIAELKSYVVQIYKEALSSGGVSDASTISYPSHTVAALQRVVPDLTKLAELLLGVDLIRFMIHSRMFRPKYDADGNVCEFTFAVDRAISLGEIVREVNNGDMFQFVFGSNVDTEDQWNLSTMFISSTDFVYILSRGLGSASNFSGEKYSGSIIVAAEGSELIDFQTPLMGYAMSL